LVKTLSYAISEDLLSLGRPLVSLEWRGGWLLAADQSLNGRRGMGLFDFLKGGKTEEKAPPKEAPAKPKEKPHAPERTAESLQAEQMRLLRGTAILNGERLKTLRPERITEDLRRIDKARGLADFELKLAEKESEKKQLEKWKLGLGLLAGMYRAQTRENQGCGMKKPTPKKYSGAKKTNTGN
jgi:hypothetical protein